MTTWDKTLERIRDMLSQHVYSQFISKARCTEETGDRLLLSLPNKFLRDWVFDHYHKFLQHQVSVTAGHPMVLELGVDPEATTTAVVTEAPSFERGRSPATQAVAEPDQSGAPKRDAAGRRLNERYCFDSFVAGASNQFAHAACRAVAQSPGQNYNPLFIFGGVGLGKTHLLNAIGLQIQADHPDWNILLLSAETFTNEVIVSIRDNQMDALRRKYREQCDVLLIDDIQFLAGKDRTQEEFFHTFNNLHQTKRQIVVTGDKFPNEIMKLEERLSSRFQWGLVADIQPPELETRVAILEKKAAIDRLDLPHDVAMFLATHVKSNVRELEGALIRVAAFASLTGQSITIEVAQTVLKDVLANKGRKPDVESVMQAVSGFYGVKIVDMKSQRRHKQITLPRQVAMYLIYKHAGLSYPQTGQALGGRDHSTVMSACRKIDRLLASDTTLRQEVDTIEKGLIG